MTVADEFNLYMLFLCSTGAPPPFLDFKKKTRKLENTHFIRDTVAVWLLYGYGMWERMIRAGHG